MFYLSIGFADNHFFSAAEGFDSTAEREFVKA